MSYLVNGSVCVGDVALYPGTFHPFAALPDLPISSCFHISEHNLQVVSTETIDGVEKTKTQAIGSGVRYVGPLEECRGRDRQFTGCLG